MVCTAVSGSIVYLPCLTGVTAVQTTQSPATLKVLWQGTAGGGPPIVAAGLVWTIGQNGTLYGIDPATGTVNQQASIGTPANHFPTPSVADGLLLAPSANRVVAFTVSTVTGTGEIHAAGAGKCLDVPNGTHLNAGCGQSAYRTLASGTWSGNTNIPRTQTVVASRIGSIYSCLLRREGGPFPRAPKAERSRTFPA